MSIDRLLAWLTSPELTDLSTGHCLSWYNPEDPGYAYPEVSGLLLTLLSKSGGHQERRRELASALTRYPDSPQGIGRGGRPYTFDLAMALRGVLFDAGGLWPLGPAREWPELLVERVLSGVATVPQPVLSARTHWSDSFGAHQMKVVGALRAAAAAWGAEAACSGEVARAHQAIATLEARTRVLQRRDGRFVIHAKAELTYLHSHCYALEGYLMAANRAAAGSRGIVARGTRWLASLQGPDGGFCGTHDGAQGQGSARADVAAQAIRIFRLVDPVLFRPNVECATRFLESLLVPGKGYLYEPHSGDLNAWTTIFAAQALAPEAHDLTARRGADLI